MNSASRFSTCGVRCWRFGGDASKICPVNQADVIVSQRMELPLLDEALLMAFIDGRLDDAARGLDAELEPQWPDAHDENFLRSRLDGARDSNAVAWGARAMVRRSPIRRMIGHAGFHGPPGVNALGLADAVELGYTVFPAFRRSGNAAEAARALMEWARQRQGITKFVASVAPTNVGSVAVVSKLGFVFAGEAHDEVDGLEHVYLLDG
jgi:[ribosomal protein S5]-alanine N-acetyltransferase